MKRKYYYYSIIPILVLVLTIANVDCSGNTSGDVPVQKTGTKEFGKGRLEYHFGIPFLYLEGTDYEVGLQYGTLLKSELEIFATKGIYKTIDEFIQKEKENASFFLKPFVRPIAKMKLRKQRKAIIKTLPEDIITRIKGMSKGSGLPEKFYHDVFVLADLIAGCSSFVINSESGLIHARNFDGGGKAAGDNPVIVNYNIVGKQKYVQLGILSIIWSFTAVNESGITFTENSNNLPKYFEKDNRDPLINSEKVLWYAKNLNQVDSILYEFSCPNDFIFTYGSVKDRRAESYDMIGGKVRAKTIINDHYFLHGGGTHPSIQKSHESIYSAMFHNMARKDKFEELYHLDTTSNNIDKAINIISNTEFYGYKEKPEMFYESIHNYQTSQSVVFDAQNNTVYFAYNPYFAAWSNWYKYNYETSEVHLYKKQNPRLTNELTKNFIDACQMKDYKSWNNNKQLRKYIKKLEELQSQHLFADKDLTTYYLLYNKDFTKAETYINKLLSDYPTIIFGYYYQGIFYQLQNQYDEAIESFNKALLTKNIPEYWKFSVYEQLAKVYNKKGDILMQKETAQQALNIYNQYWHDAENFNDRINNLKELAK